MIGRMKEMKSHGGLQQHGKRLQEPLVAESREAGDAIRIRGVLHMVNQLSQERLSSQEREAARRKMAWLRLWMQLRRQMKKTMWPREQSQKRRLV